MFVQLVQEIVPIMPDESEPYEPQRAAPDAQPGSDQPDPAAALADPEPAADSSAAADGGPDSAAVDSDPAGSPEATSGDSESVDSEPADAVQVRPQSDETTILSRARERRRQITERDPDETVLLPRTAGGAMPRRSAEPSEDSDPDDLATDPNANRNRLWLLIGAVAVIAILGLVIGFAVVNQNRTSSPGAAAGGSGSNPGGGDPALLTDELMTSPDQAAKIDKKRVWNVTITQRGTSPDSPYRPACLAGDAIDAAAGAPTPVQSVLRVLTSDGTNPPVALHLAQAYASSAEAELGYAADARNLGDCAMSGAWIYRGYQLTGLGDQATAVVIQVLDGAQPTYRTVVLTRTGRVVNVLDVASSDQPASAKRVAAAAGLVVAAQCTSAEGLCRNQPKVKAGPPPAAGDAPGYLTSGDLPPLGAEFSRWTGTAPATSDPGSGCETVTWSKVKASDRGQRTYILSDSSSRVGLDQVVLTVDDAATAKKLVDRVRSNWSNCGQRQLTASVSAITAISGVGKNGTKINGWTTQVSQKSDTGTTRYRVGIVAAGDQVIFLFLNPQDSLDLTGDQFDTIAVRAGQRAGQVS